MRDRGERRKNTWRKIKQRAESEHDEYGNNIFEHLHEYAKNKRYRAVRCATNNKGKHRYSPKNFAANKNWSSNDTRKLNEIDQQIEELQGDCD